MKKILPMLACVMVAGCAPRDASKEEPVMMKPGAYELSISGGLNPFRNPQSGAKRICITKNSETTPRLLLGPFLQENERCDTPKFERTGNALTGKGSCPAKESVGGGGFTSEFSGAISEESLEGRFKFAFDLHGANARLQQETEALSQQLKDLKLTLTAKRVGECTGTELYPTRTSSTTSGHWGSEGSATLPNSGEAKPEGW